MHRRIRILFLRIRRVNDRRCFAGTSIICDNGSIIAEGERFAMDRRMTVGEIDVESIRNDRRVNTTFAESRGLHSRQAVTIDALPQTPSALNLTRTVNPLPFVPSGSKLNSYCEEIFAIQSTGLAQRFAHTHAETAVIGISGGLDSTLALLVAVNTFDKLHKDRKTLSASQCLDSAPPTGLIPMPCAL